MATDVAPAPTRAVRTSDTAVVTRTVQLPSTWGRRDTGVLTVLVVLSAALRVFHIGSVYDVFVDELFYNGLGTSVRHGHIPPHIPPGWGHSSHEAFLIHPPGFFILLAMWQTVTGTGGNLFHQIYMSRGLNALVAALTVGLLYALGRRLAGRGAGVATALVVALDPYILRQNGRLFLETSTLFWVVAGYFVLIGLSQGRYRRPRAAAMGAGALFGLAILTKDTAAIETVGALIVLFVLGWGIPRHLAALTALSAVLTYSPYVVDCAAQGPDSSPF